MILTSNNVMQLVLSNYTEMDYWGNITIILPNGLHTKDFRLAILFWCTALGVSVDGTEIWNQ